MHRTAKMISPVILLTGITIVIGSVIVCLTSPKDTSILCFVFIHASNTFRFIFQRKLVN